MDTNTHNMQYLQLNPEQYEWHCKLMTQSVAALPASLKEHVRQQSLLRGFCGDALASWVADWIRKQEVT